MNIARLPDRFSLFGLCSQAHHRNIPVYHYRFSHCLQARLLFPRSRSLNIHIRLQTERWLKGF